MAVQRYKFLFECCKRFHEWVQQTIEIFFQHEKRNFVSPSDHVMFYLLYKHQWNTKPFHFNSVFAAKGAIYYTCSHGNSDTSCVQITCHSKGNCITLVIVNFVFITKMSNTYSYRQATVLEPKWWKTGCH